MANRWKGNFVVATAATSSGTNYTGRADGSWGLNSQLQQKQGSLWSAGIGAPSIPTIGTATSTASQQATISFTPSTITGGGTLTYTATSTPSGITGTSTTSPINITGLTNGTSYTFTVKATNSFGYSSEESLASNSVTPVAAGVLTGAGSSNNSLSAFSLYPWVSGTGFGTKAADAVGFSGFPHTVCYSPNNTTAFAGGNSFELFACSVGSTFGTKYANPSTLVGSNVNGVNMNSTGNTLFAVSYASPVVNAYTWSSGFGSKYADPSAIPSGNSAAIQSSYITNKIAFSTNATPYIRVYAWSSGFGTAYANPSTIPTLGLSMTFSPSENAIIFGDGVTPFMQAYTWSNGFGTKYSAPATALSATMGGVVFNPAETVIVVPVTATPFVMAYAWTTGSGFGTKYANPSTLPTSFGNAASFNSTNDVIIGHTLSPFISAYTWSSGFGTKYANPATLPAGGSGSPRVSSVKFSN